MRSLFDLPMTDWAQDRNALHVYALPDIPETVLAPIQKAIDTTGVCSVQPTEFLHATITRVPAFLDRIQDETLLALQDALDATVGTLSPFTTDLAGPFVSSASVGLQGQHDLHWDGLVHSVRICVSMIFDGLEMPPEPHAPHISLGYGTRDADSESLIAALAELDVGREHELVYPIHISDVRLLSVHQDAGAGIYTWDTVSTHVLGSSRSHAVD